MSMSSYQMGLPIAQDSESSYDEFDKKDKFGIVQQKDLDKITGGMQVVKEFNLDINNLDRMVAMDSNGRPSEGSEKFLMQQL